LDDLIEDIVFIWEHLRDLERDAFDTFSKLNRSIQLVSRAFDSNGIPCNRITRAIERFGILQAIRLLSFITYLRKQGITLERFLQEKREIIRDSDSDFLRIFIIPKYRDILSEG